VKEFWPEIVAALFLVALLAAIGGTAIYFARVRDACTAQGGVVVISAVTYGWTCVRPLEPKP
jgi:hypothetical protein